MEVFSYVGSAARKQTTRTETEFNFNYPFVKTGLKNGMKTGLKTAAKASPRQKEKKSLSELGKKAVFYFPLFLLALILLVVPVTVFNALSYFESHSLSLKFNPDSSVDFDFLDIAMSKFAMEDIVSDVDENGNVLDENGKILTAASIGIGQKVAFQDYKVRSGDAISTITRRFGLSNISTLIAVNNIGNVRTLRAGQILRIPSQDGLIHKVSAGDSLNAISVKYHVSVEEILDANDLTSDVLSKGMELFIPGAKMDSASLKKAMGELFVCPLKTKYRISSYFGHRKDPFTGAPSNHTGIDMACPQGTPIYSAMSGKVAYVGWSNIFGNYVIINHGNGYQTLYAHMLKTLAKTGTYVDQSTKIGLVGSTGYSTGPHLHFTVYKNGKLADPLSLIK
ncbi:MAG: M23 family metallopeptidase [Treponema sp.]|nr:M23 family metallopeptidase [Treponema sp.]